MLATQPAHCPCLPLQNKADHEKIDCDHPEHSKYYLVIVQVQFKQTAAFLQCRLDWPEDYA